MNREQVKKEARKWSERHLAEFGCNHVSTLTEFALAMMEKQREKDIETVMDHQCRAWHELCDCRGKIADAIRGEKTENSVASLVGTAVAEEASGNMIDLEQAKKRVEEIAGHFRIFQTLNYMDSHRLLALSRDLIGKAEYQKTRIGELEEPMECGHFGANLQPNDANQDICMVCGETSDLRKEVERLEKRWGESVDLVSEVEERVHRAEHENSALEAQVCGLKNALKEAEFALYRANGFGLDGEVNRSVAALTVVRVALSSASGCEHEQQLSDLRAELTEAKRAVFEDDTVKRLKEKIAELRKE